MFSWLSINIFFSFWILFEEGNCQQQSQQIQQIQHQQQQQKQQQQQQPQTRNTQWFEETIDGFLRQAQESGDTTDIQVSTCKISSQQLVATAQATAARVLKGVCNPNEIEDRFQKLEINLGDQLSALKTMVTRLEAKIIDQDQELKRQLRRLIPAPKRQTNNIVNGNSGGGSTVIDHSTSYTPPYIPSVPHRAQEITEDNEDTGHQGTTTNGPRAEEITRYNSTVHIENGKRVFSYYWTIHGMNTKITSWSQGRILRSNPFYVYPGGYRMFLKIIPRSNLSTMYIHAGITKGDYDESLQWPFELKMHLVVLNQERKHGTSSTQDLKSRLWDPKELCSGSNWKKPVFKDNQECVGLGFPHEVIKSSNFIWNDSIVIKLTVYLDF